MNLVVPTKGRGFVEITEQIRTMVRTAHVQTGLCNVFIQHTSASLVACENADPQVLRDLEAFAARFAQDGDPIFKHTAEGPDDMPAHVRAVFTQTSINIPIIDGRLHLGTWQGIFVWEHRKKAHHRQVTVTVFGTPRSVTP